MYDYKDSTVGLRETLKWPTETENAFIKQSQLEELQLTADKK